MADHVAQIRVDLKTEAVTGGFRRLSQEATRQGRRIGSALGRPLRGGINAATKSLGGMADSLGHVLKMAGTLGTAFVMTHGVHEALDLQEQFRNMAFSISKVTGHAMRWQTVQQKVAAASRATGQTSADLARAFDTVFKSTGDVTMATKAMYAVGTASTASGDDIDVLANAAQLMGRNFGVGAGQMQDAMARIIEKTGKGGRSIDQMSRRFGVMANEASAAGIHGVKGISLLLGIMERFDATNKKAGIKGMGEELAPAMKTFFQYAKDGTTQMKQLEKSGHFKFKIGTTAFEKVREILEHGKPAQVQALATFTGPARTFYDNLVKPFDTAVKEARKRGATMKEAQAEGLRAYDASLKKMAAHNENFNRQLQEAAANRKKNDPMLQMKKAEETLAQAFLDPRMMDAVKKLSADLPMLAQKFGKLVDWMVSNPFAGVGAIVGGKVAADVAKAALGNVLKKGVSKMFTGRGLELGAITLAVATAYMEVQELKKTEAAVHTTAGLQAQAANVLKGGNAKAAPELMKRIQAQIRTVQGQSPGYLEQAEAWMTGTNAGQLQKTELMSLKGNLLAIQKRFHLDKNGQPIAAASKELAGVAKEGKRVADAHGHAAKEADNLRMATRRATVAADKFTRSLDRGGGGNPATRGPGGNHGAAPRPGAG